MSVHFLPSPVKPLLHAHEKAPGALVQLAFRSHDVATSHSLISVQLVPSPLYPGRHEQVRLPTVFAQVAFTSQPATPPAHSSMSRQLPNWPPKPGLQTHRPSTQVPFGSFGVQPAIAKKKRETEKIATAEALSLVCTRPVLGTRQRHRPEGTGCGRRPDALARGTRGSGRLGVGERGR